MFKRKILIVGGTGFIGNHLVKFLKSKKYNITSISTKPPKKNKKIKGVKYIYLNIEKINQLKKIKNNFNDVINLSGYVDHSDSKKTYNTHFKGCKNLYEMFSNAKINKFVQIGSSLEYGSLPSPHKEDMKTKLKLKSVYSRSKLLSTNFLIKKYKKNKFPAVIVRPYQVYGPGENENRLVPYVIKNCLMNRIFNCSEGSQSRDFLYVDDFIRAIYRILKKKNLEGEIINIGFGSPIKVKKIISKIQNMIKIGTPVYGKIELRPDESKEFYPLIRKARKVLKWKPQTSLSTGLKKTINYFKNKK